MAQITATSLLAYLGLSADMGTDVLKAAVTLVEYRDGLLQTGEACMHFWVRRVKSEFPELSMEDWIDFFESPDEDPNHWKVRMIHDVDENHKVIISLFSYPWDCHDRNRISADIKFVRADYSRSIFCVHGNGVDEVIAQYKHRCNVYFGANDDHE